MKVLVIHGAGMNMRGKAQQEIFGPLTLPQYTEQIARFAGELGIEVSFFHSNVEGQACDALYAAFDAGVQGCIVNPADFMASGGPLKNAIARMPFPVIELHLSNPAARGSPSTLQGVCRATICGFGIHGYYLALSGLRAMLNP